LISLSKSAGMTLLISDKAEMHIFLGHSFSISCPPGGHYEPVPNPVFGVASMGFNHFGDNPAFNKLRGLGDHFNFNGIGLKDLHLLIRIFHYSTIPLFQ
jgi:hypothetical protein